VDRDVTIVVPAIPARRETTLPRALASCWAQIHPPECVIVELDWAKAGAGPNRTRGLQKAVTTWVAFLDDDDELLPHHLITLLDTADQTGADIIVPWFRVIGGADPFPGNRACGVPPVGGGMPSFPVTVIARTTVAQQAIFPARDPELTRAGIGTMPEEYQFFTSLRDKGARFVMIPDETWLYHHHAANTSGLPR
jgi:glycosyltransferase involved in cell wall biosynthesis